MGHTLGQLEGSKEDTSQYIREELRKGQLDPATSHPLAVVEPPKGELPDWFCVASVRITNSVHNTGPDFYSRLYVCWFMGGYGQEFGQSN